MTQIDKIAIHPLPATRVEPVNETIPDPGIEEFVILGGGAVVAEYYLPSLAMLGRLGATTVVEANPGAIAAVRSRYPAASYLAADYETALTPRDAGRASAVIIALPNALQVASAQLALERGFNVLCEKPLALRTADCTRLAALAADQRRLLKVAMARRYLPAWMAARELVANRELGAPVSIEIVDCAPFLWRPQTFSFFAPAAGGILADMGVHYLDYLSTLVGPLEPLAYRDDWRGGVESSLTYDLRAGNVPIRMTLSRLAGACGEIRIRCERGAIRIEKSEELQIFVTAQSKTAKEWSFALRHPFSDREWPRNLTGSFCEMLADFSGARHGKPCRTADATDAEATTHLIEWAYERRHTGAPRNRAQGGRDCPEWVITGASGFIGGHLLDRLHHDHGAAVRAIVRSPASCANIARYPAEVAPVNLLVRDEVERAVAGARIVFHLAYGRDGPNPARVTADGTKNVVDAAIAAGAEAVVVLSTMYVYGFPHNVEIVDETFPYRPYGGEYGTSKAKMERWCLTRARNAGKTRIVVLNPTCVFGPRGGAFTTLPVELARRGQFCWVEGGAGLCNHVYVENLVDAIILASEAPAANGRRFIINDGAISWREFLAPLVAPLQLEIPSYTRAELAAVGDHEPAFRVADALRAIIGSPDVRLVLKRSKLVQGIQGIARETRLGRLVEGAARTNMPTYSVGGQQNEARPPLWLAELYNPDRVRFSGQRARDELGWTPRVPLELAREKTLSWLSDAGFYRPVGLADA